MRRDQPTTPFDADADDLTQEFWGASRGWISREQPNVQRRTSDAPPAQRDDTTGSMRAIRDGFAAFRPRTAATPTGQVERVRQHGAPSRRAVEPSELAAARREATLGQLAAGHADVGGWLTSDLDEPIPVRTMRHDAVRPSPARRTAVAWPDEFDEPDEFDRAAAGQFDDFDDVQEVPLSPVLPLAERLGLGAVDPLLLRAGVAVLVAILLVPVMMALRPDRGVPLPGSLVEAAQPVAADAASVVGEASPATPSATPIPGQQAVQTDVDGSTAVTVAEPSTSDVAPSIAADAPESTGSGESSVSDRSMVESVSSDADLDAAVVDAEAERIVPACPQTYTAAAGDSWYRIADAADVTPNALLAENGATSETVILPGDDICLPEGATMPSPPAAEAPSTTDESDESDDGSDAPSTTAAPTTTEAPTTTVAPVVNLSRDEVQDLIRQTWPAEEVDKALAIARRESNYLATADNGWCCVGVFQLYWTVHQGWLDEFGITQRSDLFDARKNIAAAHHMWEQSGWGPWGG